MTTGLNLDLRAPGQVQLIFNRRDVSVAVRNCEKRAGEFGEVTLSGFVSVTRPQSLVPWDSLTSVLRLTDLYS